MGKMDLGIQPDAWLPDSFFPAISCRIDANPTQNLTSAATRGVDHATHIDKGIDHFNMSICHLDWWARHGWGTWNIWVFDQFIWRPKTAASSCIIVIARTSISSISASSATSSAKSRSVNTSSPKVTPAIPRCAVRSIIWSIGPRNKSGAIQPCRTPLPTANQSHNTLSAL